MLRLSSSFPHAPLLPPSVYRVSPCKSTAPFAFTKPCMLHSPHTPHQQENDHDHQSRPGLHPTCAKRQDPPTSTRRPQRSAGPQRSLRHRRAARLCLLRRDLPTGRRSSEAKGELDEEVLRDLVNEMGARPAGPRQRRVPKTNTLLPHSHFLLPRGHAPWYTRRKDTGPPENDRRIPSTVETRFSLPCSIRTESDVPFVRTGEFEIWFSQRQAPTEGTSKGYRENTHLTRVKVHYASHYSCRHARGFFIPSVIS